MIRFDCPSCGRRVKAPESAVGRKAKCPKCGDTVQVPNEPHLKDSEIPPVAAPMPESVPVFAPDEAEGAETFDFAALQQIEHPPVPPELPPMLPSQPPENTAGHSVQRRREREPWYYLVLQISAFIAIGVGVLLVLCPPAAVTFSKDLPPDYKIFTWIVAGALLLFVLFGPALVLLAVDIGRNLRLIRQSLERQA